MSICHTFIALCFRGIASWYGPGFDGHQAADGSIFHAQDLTAASPVLPLGSVVTVHNLRNNRLIHVRITDRGPYVRGRILDLSQEAAHRLGFEEAGLTLVEIAFRNGA